jgi:hypothetical protein
MKSYHYFSPIVSFFLLSILIFLLSSCSKQNKGPKERFPSKIAITRSFNPDWEARTLVGKKREEIEELLEQQKFHYFCCGGQSLIYFSEDGKYVLKLIKHQRLQGREARQMREFLSYKIAYEELQDQTGVLYVHLNRGSTKKEIQTVDSKGTDQLLDADEYDFILQRRGTLVCDEISRLMEDKKEEEAKMLLSDLVKLVVEWNQFGYYDKDPNTLTNFGVFNGKLFKIDVGSIQKKTGNLQRTIKKAFTPLQTWLTKNHPGLLLYLTEELIPFAKNKGTFEPVKAASVPLFFLNGIPNMFQKVEFQQSRRLNDVEAAPVHTQVRCRQVQSSGCRRSSKRIFETCSV